MRYYWPFGTTENLIYHGDNSYKARALSIATSLVLFHFDQEPIYLEDSPNIITGLHMRHRIKYPRILANSERSDLKKQICREEDLLDWYFFYHGFAALDWYRDAKFLNVNNEITHAFLSLNHLVRHKRSYRMSMLARLVQRNIMTEGIVSFHGTVQDCRNEIQNANSELSLSSKELIEKYLISQLSLPIIADRDDIDATASAAFGHQEYELRQRALFSVVNETIFYDQKLHLTEKIFQPIVCSRPFILVAAPGNLEYLRSYGFRTFSDYINEDYDSIEDDDLRQDAIADELTKLANRPLHELKGMLKDMQPILDHNKQHFFGEFRRIIVDELVENFNQCLRIWNNGRVDDRVYPVHPDPESVKRLLLG